MQKMSKSEAGKLGQAVSREIHQAKKQQRIDEYNKNPIPCRSCGDSLSYDDVLRKKKFHNSSCAAKYNNSKQKKYHNCKMCDVEFEHSYSSTNQYCSLQCQKDYEWARRKEIVKEGKGTSNNVKRYLLETTGHKCNKCDNTEWNGQPIPIELEHIDGNSDNNNLDNVELLCPNCHAQTPTYKGKNKGNGRWKRRQRYTNGVSY